MQRIIKMSGEKSEIEWKGKGSTYLFEVTVAHQFGDILDQAILEHFIPFAQGVVVGWNDLSLEA